MLLERRSPESLLEAAGRLGWLAEDCAIDGRQLYLGIEVNSDGEMTPRRYIDNVPYAWSLRPGAKVEGSLDDPLFYTINTGSGDGMLRLDVAFGQRTCTPLSPPVGAKVNGSSQPGACPARLSSHPESSDRRHPRSS